MSSSNAVAKIDFDKEQLQVIESQFFPAGATKAEQQYCFAVARELGLSPILKEIHFVPRRAKVGDKWVNKIEPMVGRDGHLAIAHKSGQLAGLQTTTCIKDIPQLVNGKWESRPDLVSTTSVWRKDSNKPFVVEVAYSEFEQKGSDGKPCGLWGSKRLVMISKCSESLALRKAFNIHGVYCPEEIGAGFETENGDIITQAVDAEFSRVEPDKSRLSIVVKPPPEEPPPPAAPPAIIEDDESEWPEPPPERHASSTSSDDDVVGQIIALLEAKKIEHEIDMENGIISAKSYNERTLLKDSGFKWNPENKRWQFNFEPDPF